MVAAQQDPGIRTAVVKLGHIDRRFDGEPAVGRVTNLRLSDDGMELFGDLEGVPKWLADVLGSAFPSRSVEAALNYKGATGHEHKAVLTALALLGVTVPAIESLDDIKALYDEPEFDVAAAQADGATIVHATINREKKGPRMFEWLKRRTTRKPVAASVAIDDVYNEFYEEIPSGSWAWVREVFSDFIIVDDGNGDLYQIPWSEGTDGDVMFGDPVRVKVEYVPAQDDESDDAPIMLGADYDMAVLARFSPQDPRLSSRGVPINQPEGGHMEMKDLLVRLGLPEDASDDDIESKVTELATTPAPDAPAVSTEVPDGMTLVDTETLDGLKVAASRGQSAWDEIRKQRKDELLDGAVRAGKFPPSRRDHYASLYDADEEGTRELVNQLATGLVPVEASGHAGSGDVESDAIWSEISKMSSVIGKEG